MSRKKVTDERKEQIVDAMMACLQEKSFNEITIKMIAQAAGLTPGLIHYYFKSKNEIVQSFVERCLTIEESFQQQSLPENSGAPLSKEQIFTWFRSMYSPAQKPYIKAYCQLYAAACYDGELRNIVLGVYDTVLASRRQMLLSYTHDEAQAGHMAMLLETLVDGMAVMLALYPSAIDHIEEILEQMYCLPEK